MRETIRYCFVLTLICIVAAGLLAGVNYLTKSRIIAQAQAQEDSGLKELFPQAANFEAVKSGEEFLYYKVNDKDSRTIGVAFKAQAKGYSSTIEIMAGMLSSGTIVGIKIISQNETPGLGTQIAEKHFTDRFKDKQYTDDIEAITGATISSGAVIEAVKSKAAQVKKALNNG